MVYVNASGNKLSLSILRLYRYDSDTIWYDCRISASEVTTLLRYRNLNIIIIIRKITHR